jgi:type I restriction enzyme S subunit
MTDTLHLLEKHFDTAFAAPDGVKKLRELILTLAMQGKLVPQDPNDEPASELLKKIEAEKQRSIQEGKLKKSQPLPEIKPEEIPYDLPEGWEWVRLNSIAIRIHYGYTASANHNLNEFRLLRITDIQNNTVQWESVPGCHISAKEAEQYLLNENDILIARTGGTVGKSYLIKNLNLKAVFASYLIRVIPTTKMDVNYLKLFIESPLYWSQLYEKCSGTGQPNVNGTSLSTLLVSLPPLAEQKCIVEKIDRLMAGCDELEQKRSLRDQKRITVHTAAINRLLNSPEDDGRAWQFITQNFKELYSTKENITELRKAILQLGVMGKLVPQDPNDEPANNALLRLEQSRTKLLTEKKVKYRDISDIPEIEALKYEIPSSWSWTHFHKVVFFQEGPGIRKWQFTNQGIKLLNVSNILFDGSLDFSNSDKYVSTDEFLEKYTHFEINEGDLLFASSGGSWGKIAWYINPGFPVMLNTSTIRLRFFDKSFEGNYLYYFLQTEYFRKQLLLQLVGMQPNFGSTHLSRIFIPIPPLAEQKRIVEKIDRLMALCDQLEQHLESATHQQTRLLQAVMAQV